MLFAIGGQPGVIFLFRRLWRNHRVLLLGFVVALRMTVFLFVRTVIFTLHWAHPMHQEQTIEGWMPLRYVARILGCPAGAEVLGGALDLTPDADRPRFLAEIVAERESSLEDAAETLRGAIAARRDGTN